MLHRVRLAMQTQTFAKMSGDVEVDETYIGGKARFMHPDRKDRMMKGRRGGVTGKAAVMGLISTDTPKAPAKDTPEPSAFEDMSPFERLKEFTRRLVAVPKEEITQGDLAPKREGHDTSPA